MKNQPDLPSVLPNLSPAPTHNQNYIRWLSRPEWWWCFGDWG